jgi:GNAT superfamily N-acetyltransferase
MEIVCLCDMPHKIPEAAAWFSQKWCIPEEAYRQSMADSLLPGAVVPRWYVGLDGERIVAGIGVIENDFHNRLDLTPNVCAVYVEPEYRNQGIAGRMLDHVCQDMKKEGIDTLYLLTDHDSFYERYGWRFYCLVQGDGEEMSRMYIHK